MSSFLNRDERSRHFRRHGLTLLEVILALVIFVSAMAAVGQLVSNGVRGALQSRFRLQAALLCEAKVAEVVAGALPLQASQGIFPEDTAWSWTVAVTPSEIQGLLRLEVTVERQAPASRAKVSYAIARYVRDPQLYYAAEEEAAANAAEESSSSSESTSP